MSTPYTTRPHTDYTPAEIRAMSDSPRNRGLLTALTRFGSSAERKAANDQLTAWYKAASPSGDAA